MDMTYYAFATYIFFLVCGAIWVYAKLMRGAKGKDDKSGYEKEQRLFSLYQNVEDMMSDFEEYAENSKKDTEAAIGKVVVMLEEMRQLSVGAKSAKPVVEPAARGVQWNEHPAQPVQEMQAQPAYRPARQESNAKDEQSVPPLKTNEKIQLLNAQGFNAAEIAKTLGVSVREVSLALEMLRK